MARIMRMPPKSDLPDGPHREFVEELRRYYRIAGRPSLREVSRAIEGRADLKEVTASQETVRRMLKGMVLPTDWDRVYAVFFVLCEMGKINPDDQRWHGEDSRFDPEPEKQLRVPQSAMGQRSGSRSQPSAHPPAVRVTASAPGLRPRRSVGNRRA